MWKRADWIDFVSIKSDPRSVGTKKEDELRRNAEESMVVYQG